MEESQAHLAYYLVLFTDVLGQRERLRDLRTLPCSEEERNAAMAVLRDTAGVLVVWREMFKNYFNAWQAPPSEGEYPIEVRKAISGARACDIAYRQFSDSMTASVCLIDDGHEGSNTLAGVQGVLLAACHMHALTLYAGKPTRGGIDVGLAMPLPEGDIYGPALERAVFLEASAGYPRIAVGEELVRYLGAFTSHDPKTRFGIIAREVAMSCQRLVFEDLDGTAALDFLGEEIRRQDSESTLGPVLPKAYRFVRSSLIRWRTDEKIGPRYAKLWAYFRSRAYIWGTDIERLVQELESES